MSRRESWPGEPGPDELEDDPDEPEPHAVHLDGVDDDIDDAQDDTGDNELPKLRGPDVHAPGDLEFPEGIELLEGSPNGARRGVAVVVARFNGDITSRLLDSALAELESAGVARESITVMPVPGAFELPLGAMALAKTRRYACVVALGCIVRGDTPHFDFVAGEAASGLQLAALETGVPVSFGVLTLETVDQADSRIDKGAEAVRSALEMADAFARLRATAAQAVR
jgi:6,7-dimethyl-8-ribityllumazine synthase